MVDLDVFDLRKPQWREAQMHRVQLGWRMGRCLLEAKKRQVCRSMFRDQGLGTTPSLSEIWGLARLYGSCISFRSTPMVAKCSG
jgi:hypothetical protein